MELKKIGVLALAIVAVSAVVGCGAGPQQIEEPSKQDVSKMEDLRKIFDSVGGDYSKLNDAQKKQFLDYGHGKQAEVDHLWAYMQNPRGGGVAPAEHSPSGPGGVTGPGAAGGNR